MHARPRLASLATPSTARGWRAALPLSLLLIAMLSCTPFPGGVRPTPTPTPTPVGLPQLGGATQPAATSTDTTPTPTPPTPTLTPTRPSPTPTPTTPTPTPSATPFTPSPSGGPYVVKQIQTLGGEVISGVVCKVTQPFSVNSVTPKVSFNFVFVPEDAQHGRVTYTYTISSAGESHDAQGTYTIRQVGTDGTLELALAVSDHVVFKGFDGSIPLRYKFDLVPTAGVPCPG